MGRRPSPVGHGEANVAAQPAGIAPVAQVMPGQGTRGHASSKRRSGGRDDQEVHPCTA